MGKFEDLTGQRFGRLVVIKRFVNSKNRKTQWLCKCDCGNETIVYSTHLKRGFSQSCGCFKRDNQIDVIKKIKKRHIKNMEIYGTMPEQLDKATSINNTSGTKGVCWHKGMKKWVARIGINRSRIHLGYFDNIEDAIATRKAAEEKYFKPVLEKYEEHKKDGKSNE